MKNTKTSLDGLAITGTNKGALVNGRSNRLIWCFNMLSHEHIGM